MNTANGSPYNQEEQKGWGSREVGGRMRGGSGNWLVCKIKQRKKELAVEERGKENPHSRHTERKKLSLP